MKIITPYSKTAGDIGVDFAEQHFIKEGSSFVRASKLQDLEQGIDCFINKIPTDVKNTLDVYCCQIMTDTGKINTRHPFKKNSKVTHYCVVNVPSDDPAKGKFIEHINIKERLLRDLVKDEASLKGLYKELQALDKKDMKDYGISQSQACFKIKQLLSPYLKPEATISYVEPAEADGEISFRIYKSKRKVNNTPANLDIKSILSKYKTEEKPNSGENIIVVNV